LRDPIKVNAAVAKKLCAERGVEYDRYVAAGRLDITPGLVWMTRKGKSNFIHDQTEDKDFVRSHARAEDQAYLPPARTEQERAIEEETRKQAEFKHRLLTGA
jgi:hypothetical protein